MQFKKVGIPNLIHASGDESDAKQEIAHWFSEEEIFSYDILPRPYGRGFLFVLEDDRQRSIHLRAYAHSFLECCHKTVHEKFTQTKRT